MKGERVLAKETLSPGVHLIDSDYHGVSGATRYSSEFWEKIKPRLGNLKDAIKEAHMTFSEKKWYRFYLITKDNITLEFRGFASGYGGTGPSACYDILKDCGWEEEGKVIFEIGRNEFSLKR